MTITAPTVEHLIERAHLYLGQPERHDHVAAIRLTGTISIIVEEKDRFYDHQDTVSMDLNILRERTEPMTLTSRIASGQ